MVPNGLSFGVSSIDRYDDDDQKILDYSPVMEEF